MTTKPIGYEEDLADFGPVVFDMSEPIGWGFVLLKQIGEDRFEALKVHGDLVFIGKQKVRAYDDQGFFIGTYEPEADWALVVRWLTEQEAIAKYGPITHVEIGPKGGFQSVTYGHRTFRSKRLRPAAYGGPARSGR